MPDRFSISDVAPACWRLGRRFDLVVLTGHAFQVFLTDDDQRAVLSTIAEHLAPRRSIHFRYSKSGRPGVA